MKEIRVWNLYFYPYLIFSSCFKLPPVFGPYSVMIDIEDECDLHCKMCYFHSPFIEEKFRDSFTRMEFSDFANLITEFTHLRVKKLILCGKGEPFLHPEIAEMIKLVKSQGFYLNIFTNGIHINEKYLKVILDFKVDRLTFSIHAGDEDTYYRVHPTAPEGAFSKIETILKRINKFKEENRSKLPYLKFVYVIYKDNYRNINEMIKFARKHRANEILFKPVQLFPQQKELSMDESDITWLIDEIRKLKIDIKNNLNNYIWSLTNKKSSETNTRKRLCFLPWYQSVIATNGDVLFCTYNQIKMGNIKENKFSKIWFSRDYQKLRKELPCNSCPGISVYPFLRVFKRIFS